MKLSLKNWLNIIFESTITDIYVDDLSAYANNFISERKAATTLSRKSVYLRVIATWRLCVRNFTYRLKEKYFSNLLLRQPHTWKAR
jgi:hypothetical protein